MDYVAWVARTKEFISEFKKRHPKMNSRIEIGPPATSEQIAEAEKEIGRPLPAQLREFLTTASGSCNFGYWWEPEEETASQAAVEKFGKKYIPGGLEGFADVGSLAYDYEFQHELVEEDVYGDAPFLQDPLPIGAMGNGDHIAIDLNGDAVVFLSHDDRCYVLAPDFDSFLESWEKICYLDFDLSPYERFVDKEGGGLNTSDADAIERLRRLILP